MKKPTKRAGKKRRTKNQIREDKHAAIFKMKNPLFKALEKSAKKRKRDPLQSEKAIKKCVELWPLKVTWGVTEPIVTFSYHEYWAAGKLKPIGRIDLRTFIKKRRPLQKGVMKKLRKAIK